MRWFLFVLLVLCVIGVILFASHIEFDAVFDLQGHRVNNAAAGLAGLVVFFIIAAGTALFLAR